jgi:hypothetical protein
VSLVACLLFCFLPAFSVTKRKLSGCSKLASCDLMYVLRHNSLRLFRRQIKIFLFLACLYIIDTSDKDDSFLHQLMGQWATRRPIG